jgi:hypothetical protein
VFEKMLWLNPGDHQGVAGDPVEVVVDGRKFDSMVLAKIGCGGENYRHDIAVLVFKHASTGATT